MHSLLVRSLILSILFYRSLAASKTISRRELKNPKTVLGKVFSFVEDHPRNYYNIESTKKYQVSVPLRDLRTLDEVPDLKSYGFTYVRERKIAGAENLRTASEAYKAAMEADAVELVKDLTGAKLAISFSSSLRIAAGGVAQPIRGIHSDMSPKGAEFVKDHVQRKCLGSEDPREIEFGEYLKEGKDVVILNVWRPLRPVGDNHLGLCKWGSLLKEDALDSTIKPTNGGNTLQRWQYRDGQEWYYLSEQQPDEVYVFMQHDDGASDGHGVNVPHASFNFKEDRNKAMNRMSFETRVMAIVKNEETST